MRLERSRRHAVRYRQPMVLCEADPAFCFSYVKETPGSEQVSISLELPESTHRYLLVMTVEQARTVVQELSNGLTRMDQERAALIAAGEGGGEHGA